MPDIETRLHGLRSVTPPTPSVDDAWDRLLPRLVVTETEYAGEAPAETFVSLGRPRRRWILAAAVVIAVIAATIAAFASRSHTAQGPFTDGTDDGTIPRFLLDKPPASLVLSQAFDPMPGAGSSDSYAIGLRDGADPATAIWITAWPGSSTSEGPNVQSVDVNGIAGQFTSGSSSAFLSWNGPDFAAQVQLNGPRADRALALDVGLHLLISGPPSSPCCGASGAPSVTLRSIPSGFEVLYSGLENALAPEGGYEIDYQKPGASRSSGPEGLGVGVTPIGYPTDRLAALYGLTATEVDGHTAYMGHSAYGVIPSPLASSRMLVIDVSSKYRLTITGTMSDDQLVAVARSLRRVPDREWRSRLGSLLQNMNPSAASDTPASIAEASTTSP